MEIQATTAALLEVEDSVVEVVAGWVVEVVEMAQGQVAGWAGPEGRVEMAVEEEELCLESGQRPFAHDASACMHRDWKPVDWSLPMY